MTKYFLIPIFLFTALLGAQAQTLPNSAEQWIQFLLNAKPNSLIPLERDFANAMITWQKKLAITSTWREEQEAWTLLAKELQTKDVLMLEYLLLEEAFRYLSIEDFYEPTIWLVDASKQAQATSANVTNPFTALAIPSSENKLLSGAGSLLNKVQTTQKMSHIERVLRLLTTLQKRPESQQLSILSVFFGKEKSQRILPMVKVADQAMSKYDQLKNLKSKVQDLQEIIAISNLTHFYNHDAYQKLLHNVFSKQLINSLSLPDGSDPQGMIVALMTALLENKHDKNQTAKSLELIYLHPKVVPLLLEISNELQSFMKRTS